jgi:hypothetical protein
MSYRSMDETFIEALDEEVDLEDREQTDPISTAPGADF